MGFRGKLPPFFFMSLIQILDSHCILWWTSNRQIEKEDLKKISHIFYSDAEERKYTIDFHFTTHRSICPIKKALLLERNGSRHYSEHNYLTWYRSALFCHRPLIESSTTPIDFHGKDPTDSSLPWDSKVFSYAEDSHFIQCFWHLLPQQKDKDWVVPILCTLQNSGALQNIARLLGKNIVFCFFFDSWLFCSVQWTPGMLLASTGLQRDSASSQLVNGQALNWPGVLAPRKTSMPQNSSFEIQWHSVVYSFVTHGTGLLSPDTSTLGLYQ